MKNYGKWLIGLLVVAIAGFAIVACVMDETPAEGEIAVSVDGDKQNLPTGKIGIKPGTKLTASYTGDDIEDTTRLQWQWYRGTTALTSAKTATYTTSDSDLNWNISVQLTIKDKKDPTTGQDLVLIYQNEFTVTNLTVAQFKYAGTWVGKPFVSATDGKTYTETVEVDEDKFNLTNDQEENLTFTVTKWVAWGSASLSIPSDQALPSGYTANNGWVLEGSVSSSKGYPNTYTKIIMFLSDDGTKFIRGTVVNTSVTILQNSGRVFERAK